MLLSNTKYGIRNTLALLLCMADTAPAEFSDTIRVNQLGYLPGRHKAATIQSADTNAVSFRIMTDDATQPVTRFKGQLGPATPYQPARETVRRADFTAFNEPGTYRLWVGNSCSYPFTISPSIYKELAPAALKFFYYSRCSTALPEPFAGKWHRPMALADDAVVVHQSAASKQRPAGSTIAAPGGWFDAGDYNKYSVNTAVSTHALLALHEAYPTTTLNADIPESADAVPDLLNEALWSIQWLLKMQDPSDGGVYHKLSAENFCAMDCPPHQLTATRYVLQKTTASSLDFAAVMAQASRIYANYESVFPGLSQRCLKQARKAWAWAQRHPHTFFQQQEGFNTGLYRCHDGAIDEWYWAATELFITTGEKQFLKKHPIKRIWIGNPRWGQTTPHAAISLILNREKLDHRDLKGLFERFTAYTDELLTNALAHGAAYETAITRFPWGSNSVVMNQAMMTMVAHHLTGDSKYLDFSIHQLDFVLGRNPLNRCFVTGFGHKRCMNIHHRPSASDGVREPIPGMLVSGPTPYHTNDAGHKAYPTRIPALCYIDDERSYSTNEVAINWNAPLVYVLGAIRAIFELNIETTNGG